MERLANCWSLCQSHHSPLQGGKPADPEPDEDRPSGGTFSFFCFFLNKASQIVEQW